MSFQVTDDCAGRIKEIEDRLLWALKITKEGKFEYAVPSNLIPFLALSCRFEARGLNMDPQCQNVMSGYEDDILKLSFRTDAEKIAGLESIAKKIESNRSGR